MKQAPRTLFIKYKHVQYTHDSDLFSRVKTIEHAEKLMKKRRHDNIAYAFYFDTDGKKHKMLIKK